MTDHVELAANAGKAHGREDAVYWLFSGWTDDQTVLVLDEKLKSGDLRIRAIMPHPQETGRPYPPTDIWLSERITGGDSPYSYYMTMCDAYDDAYRQAIIDHVDKIAKAIREGVM